MGSSSSKTSLTPIILNTLGSIFEENGWEIDDGSHNFSLFKRFSAMLGRLEIDQQKFILELTRNYRIVKLDEYLELLKKVLIIVSSNLPGFDNLKRFYIVPIMGNDNRLKGDIKSSHLVAYLFNSIELHYLPQYQNKNFILQTVLTSETIHKINIADNTKLLLVDDYIGSGGSVVDSLNYYKQRGVREEKMFVVSLIAQEEGKKLVEERLYRIYVGEVLSKTFTGKMQGDELNKNLSLMRKISELIPVKEHQLLGYGGSEALVTLIRTPNNTFPIYWFEKKKGDIAPFPRTRK